MKNYVDYLNSTYCPEGGITYGPNDTQKTWGKKKLSPEVRNMHSTNYWRQQQEWLAREAAKYTPRIPGVTTTRKIITRTKFNVHQPDICCVICLDNIKQQSFVGTLVCHHVFHWKCIDRWLRVSAICPTCRHYVYRSK